MKSLSQIFQPFSTVGKVYLAAISVFWIGMAFLAWFNAPELLPGPGKVGNALIKFLSSTDFYGDLVQSIIVTCKAMFYSIVIAATLAYLSTTAFFRPVAYFLIKLRYMSLIGLVFTFMMVLSNAGEVKMAMLMFGIIPFFTLSLLSVIEKVRPEEHELCQTLEMSPWETLYELVIFGRMDQTVETIRANFAMAWLMITMVETFSMAQGGIGVQLFRANKFNELDKIFALQIIIFALGMLFDYMLAKARYTAFPHVRYAELKR